MDDAPFDVLLFDLIEAEYLLLLDAALGTSEPRVIEREVRRAGGSALRCARVLAHWGARVCLVGNPLADDSNGRLIRRELDEIANLTLLSMPDAPLPADYETPYSVVCLARDNWRAVVTRYQHAQQLDRLNRATQADTTKPDENKTEIQHSPCEPSCAPHISTHAWPQARLAAICGDHLAHAAFDLARTMSLRHVPLFAFDAILDATAEVVLWSAPKTSGENEEQLSQWLDDLPQGLKNTILINRNEAKVWWRSSAQLQNLTLPRTARSADADLLARDGLESIFLAGLLWARLHQWEWKRASRFASAAWALARSSPHELPSLGQIEAVS